VRRPIKVAFVLHVMQVAGAEVLVAETIRRLGGRVDPVIFCLDAVGPLGEQMQAENVPVVSFGRRPGRDWGVVTRMSGELRRRRIDVIHAHQYTPFFYSALARVLAGGRPRLMFTEHGRHFPDLVGWRRRLMNRWVLARLSTETNAVCEFSAHALRTVEGFSEVPVGVVENGIDARRYAANNDLRAACMRLGLDPDRRYVANVARFHPVKDQATLVDAFVTVAASRPDVDLLFVGDGPLRSDLEARIARFGLEGRTKFLGVRRDVPDVLAATSVFCLNSLSEAASLTLLEAMASGVPVVVTKVGGNPEIVRDGIDGLLVERGDASGLSAALLRMLDTPELARHAGASGAARVRDLYNIDRTVERYFQLYERMAER
jgi:glycosyltransferase involved in cell wall biosynthesis